jgi:putative phosphoribosyl transferase
VTRRFADRADAGRRLGEALVGRWPGQPVVVLALPRGGVPVAAEVATALGAPLDVLVVRKLGVPWQPELAMGAVAGGGVRFVNASVVRQLAVPADQVEAVARRELVELERRERAYRGERPPTEVAGRVVVLVDDGLATGATVRAAVQAVRTARPARVVVAVPVGAPESCRGLREVADEVLCLEEPERFAAVGAWYDDFDQTGDDEVRRLLSAGGG